MADFKENHCILCPKAFCCSACRYKHEKIVHKMNIFTTHPKRDCQGGDMQKFGINKNKLADIQVSNIDNNKERSEGRKIPKNVTFCTSTPVTEVPRQPEEKETSDESFYLTSLDINNFTTKEERTNERMNYDYSEVSEETFEIAASTTNVTFSGQTGNENLFEVVEDAMENKNSKEYSVIFEESAVLDDQAMNEYSGKVAEKPECFELSIGINDSTMNEISNGEKFVNAIADMLENKPSEATFDAQNSESLESTQETENSDTTLLINFEDSNSLEPLETSEIQNESVLREKNFTYSFEEGDDIQISVSSTINVPQRVWHSIASSIKSAFDITKNYCTFGEQSTKRVLDISDDDTDPTPKRRKYESIKCRPPIHELPILRLKFNKSTQTEERYFTKN